MRWFDWPRSGEVPAGDIILAIVSDEEDGGTVGAKFLVEEHPEQFEGVKYAIGEFGGFPLAVAGTRFYPIQIAERVGVEFTLTMRGPAGHGSLPASGGAMALLGRTLTRLDKKRLPVHIVDANRAMLETMVSHTTGASQKALKALMNERTAGPTLSALRSQLGILEPVLRNTVSPTIVRGGDKHNVIPPEVTLTLDGRMLPASRSPSSQPKCNTWLASGYRWIIRPSRSRLSPSLTWDSSTCWRRSSRSATPRGFRFRSCSRQSRTAGGSTSLASNITVSCRCSYRTTLLFQDTVHGADERIPVEALHHGCEAILDLLRRYRG